MEQKCRKIFIFSVLGEISLESMRQTG